MDTFETLLVEPKGPALLVTVNRPKALNALNGTVISELTKVMGTAAQNKDLAGVVVTGQGDKAFVAGADITAMLDMDAKTAQSFSQLGHALGDAIAKMSIPVIAAVNGFALGGGCELALACDFIYASERAKFGQPEVKLGVIPGFGGTQRLLRRIGPARALELCITGEMIDAKQAMAWGLVNRVCAPDKLVQEALAAIETVSGMGPLAVAAAKRLIHEGAQLPLDKANQLEAEAFGSLFGTQDQREGMQAFVEKRKATFRGA